MPVALIFSYCATSMAEKTVLNMNKSTKTNKTRTEFNLFDSQEKGHYLCSKGIKVLSGSTEGRISVEESSSKTTSKKHTEICLN